MDELRDGVLLCLLGDLLQVLVIAEVLELLVPSIRNTSNLHTSQLVLLVIGLILAALTRRRLLLLPHSLERLTFTLTHASPIKIVLPRMLIIKGRAHGRRQFADSLYYDTMVEVCITHHHFR